MFSAKRPDLIRLSSARLATVYMAVFGLGICILLSLVYFLTVRMLDRETDALIDAEFNSLHDDYHTGGPAQLVRAIRLRKDDWGRATAIYLLADPYGRPIEGNISQWPQYGTTREGWFEFEIAERADGRSAVHPVRGRVLGLPGGFRLFVGRDLDERQSFFETLRAALLVGVGACMLLAVTIGAAYRRRVRRRVLAIAETCESVMAGDLSRRLSTDGSHDELDSLAGSVNHMLERIEQQTNTLRTTFDSAAHDLRAPLYRARVRLEDTLEHTDAGSAVRATIEATIVELERVQRTLGTLLQIAQAEGQDIAAAAADPFDLAMLARELVELYTPEASARSLELTCEAPASATVRGNRQLFAQALVNLLENSFKYVPQGGHIAVRVSQTGSKVILEVADDGPGIPEAQRADMLKPFVRLERDRDQIGSGLGLSLVAAVVRMHRATLELLDNKPGLLVRWRMPAANDRA